MDSHTEANVNQLAKDVHFVVAPLRHLWHLLAIFILLMLAPVVIVAGILALLFSSKPLTELEVQALKLLMWAFGHIVFAFWFMLVTRHLEVRRNGGNHDDGLRGAYARTFIGWAGSFAGTTLMIMVTRGENTPLALALVAVGTMLPALLYGLYHLGRGPKPDDHEAVEEEKVRANNLTVLSVVAIVLVFGWFAWSTHQFSVNEHRRGLAEQAEVRAEQEKSSREWKESQTKKRQACWDAEDHPEAGNALWYRENCQAVAEACQSSFYHDEFHAAWRESNCRTR